ENRTLSRVFLPRHRKGIRRAWVSDPFGAPAVRASHCLPQAGGLAAAHHNDRAVARPRRPAADLRVAGHARRRTVRDLVTGATGFTGGHLARSLAAAGHSVRALVRDRNAARDLEASGIDLVPGDIRDRAALDTAVAGVDVVYH